MIYHKIIIYNLKYRLRKKKTSKSQIIYENIFYLVIFGISYSKIPISYIKDKRVLIMTTIYKKKNDKKDIEKKYIRQKEIFIILKKRKIKKIKYVHP